MRAALWAEWTKTTRALTPRIVAAAIVLGPLAISAGLLGARRTGSPAIDAQLAPFTTGEAWADLTTTTAVVAAAGGVLACGILLAWMFAREFTDHTVTGLFANPVSLAQVAAAKLLIYAGAVAVIAVVLGLALVPVGLGLGYPPPAATDWVRVLKAVAVVGLTGLVPVPCAWIATTSRGLLAPVGLAVAILVSAQIAMVTVVGAWLPFAAPGAWAGLAGVGAAGTTPVQLALVLPTGALFAALTAHAWQRLRV